MVAKVCGSAEGFREVMEFPCPCRVGRGLLIGHLEYERGPVAEDASVKRTRPNWGPGFVQIPPTPGGFRDIGPFGLDSWP